MSKVQLDKGSFRDPASFVFHFAEGVYRAVDDETWSVFEQLRESGFIGEAATDHTIVDTAEVVDEGLVDRFKSSFPDMQRFLRHDSIGLITYPYEWSFSMLADAALLELDLQRRLLEYGFSLKDASAFNVQFVGPTPIFIDIGSFEVPHRLDIWFAYGQFCRMFLYPLMLFQSRKLSFRAAFLGGLDGISVSNAWELLGWAKGLAPAACIDVFLQYLLSRRQVGGNEKTGKTMSAQATADVRVQQINLDRLHRKIVRMKRRYRTKGVWSDYDGIRNYSEGALDAKHRIMQDILDSIAPETVLDVGCNTGEFSIIAAESGARVVALDADHDSVEELYRKAKDAKLNILPLVANVAEPSPGIGLFNEERIPLLDRVSGECVFALALIHHLLVTACMPLTSIVRLFDLLSDEYLVIEYVDPEDSMFRELLAVRRDHFATFSEEKMLEAFAEKFELVKRYAIPESKRSVLLMKKVA